ncbi:centaurin-gamma-1A isoform X2 [Cimex lectularius]|uniref:Centaurin-gamma-1A n=1 Tax=Cimex lectularius TaxID=79782 RepID=A0A8I6RHN7_CIMLE|nr:centaurin-gamma-1A isoform X2 [Cimex lectularius]
MLVVSQAMKWFTPDRNKSAAQPPAESLLRSLKRRSLRLKRPKPQVLQEKRKSDSFVNSQEWTVSRVVPDLRLGIVGSLSSGKSALVHRYLTGSYMQEESPEGGRFKKEVLMDGQSHLLLIRDEGGPPELQFTAWVDAVIFVFSLENEASFNAIYTYYTQMAHYRNSAEIPLILVGTQDAISESNPRVIDDARARKLANDLKRCSYYETCATYGLNVERVFQDACQKIVQQRLSQSTSCLATSTSRPSTPLTPMPPPQILLPSSPTHLHSNSHKEVNRTVGQCLSISSHALHKELTSENNNISKIPTQLDNLTLNPGMSCKDLPTPSSTPTATRKNRRRSNLFTPSKKGEDKLKNGGELGSGRAIPVKQGTLYKRSSKALNKEWKKKYVTLCDDGRLTYHPSLHDYMEDVHGKEIPLQYVTVKVPGQKPRGSKTIVQSNGSNDALSSLSNFHHKEKRIQDKVLLTAFEILKEPGRIPNNEDSLIIPMNALMANGTDSKAETPNVKKRHRRMKSSSVKNHHDCDDTDGYEFLIVSLDNKQWHFEANSCEERDDWVTAIENQILNTLQSVESSKGKLRLNSTVEANSIQSIRTMVQGNGFCADCDAPNPDWASLNLGVLLCIECSGIHRNLGSHISKVRSLHLDEWPAGHLSVMLSVGNRLANSIWENDIRGRRKPIASSPREEKERWALAKYVTKEFLQPLEPTVNLSQLLIDSTSRNDIRGVIEALVNGDSDLANTMIGPKDSRTALHIACATGNLAVAQLLLWHNADVNVLDNEGRSCVSLARSAARGQSAEGYASSLVDLLLSVGCQEIMPTLI